MTQLQSNPKSPAPVSATSPSNPPEPQRPEKKDYLKSFLKALVKPFDPLVVKIASGFFLLTSIGLVANFAVYRHFLPHTYTIAAGNKNGESYLLSKALEKVVEKRFCKNLLGFNYCNLTLIVKETGGTTENLKDLSEGQAQLGTAQLDIATESEQLIQNTEVRAVATLYEDKFQLIVPKDSDISEFLDPKYGNSSSSPSDGNSGNPSGNNQNSSNSKGKYFIEVLKKHEDEETKIIIEAPFQGGQRESFRKIAAHFNLEEGVHYCFRDRETGKQSDVKNCAASTARSVDAAFRVRILGNQEITDKLEQGWRLLPIEQAEAIQLKGAAFQPAKIPLGAYQGNSAKAKNSANEGNPKNTEFSPVPDKSLNTIAVKRLLLARIDVPDWLVYEMSDVLNKHGQELANCLMDQKCTEDGSQSRTQKDENYIKNFVIPLIPNISNLNKSDQVGSMGIILHPGAYRFYQPDASLVAGVVKYAGSVVSLISITTLGFSSLWALNLQLRKRRKDKSDEYVESAVYLMGLEDHGKLSSTGKPLTSGSVRKVEGKLKERMTNANSRTIQENEIKALPPDDQKLDISYIKELINWVCRLEELREVFNQAQTSLGDETISEESFRTFTEAYKTSREFIEGRIESCQRTIDSYYVRKVMHLLDNGKRDLSLENLEQIRDEATKVLTSDYIFSRESFRTFMEAYNLVQQAVKPMALK